MMEAFCHGLVDGVESSHVKCDRCSTLLHWNSRDGTIGLRVHLSYCQNKKPQAKIYQQIDLQGMGWDGNEMVRGRVGMGLTFCPCADLYNTRHTILRFMSRIL